MHLSFRSYDPLVLYFTSWAVWECSPYLYFKIHPIENPFVITSTRLRGALLSCLVTATNPTDARTLSGCFIPVLGPDLHEVKWSNHSVGPALTSSETSWRLTTRQSVTRTQCVPFNDESCRELALIKKHFWSNGSSWALALQIIAARDSIVPH